jgi:hypothetical protein
VPLLTAYAVLLDILTGGSGGHLSAAAVFLDQPLSFLLFAMFTLFFGPIPEELVWRGYALDRLQLRWSALIPSFVLGIVWQPGICHCFTSRVLTRTDRRLVCWLSGYLCWRSLPRRLL